MAEIRFRTLHLSQTDPWLGKALVQYLLQRQAEKQQLGLTREEEERKKQEELAGAERYRKALESLIPRPSPEEPIESETPLGPTKPPVLPGLGEILSRRVPISGLMAPAALSALPEKEIPRPEPFTTVPPRKEPRPEILPPGLEAGQYEKLVSLLMPKSKEERILSISEDTKKFLEKKSGFDISKPEEFHAAQTWAKTEAGKKARQEYESEIKAEKLTLASESARAAAEAKRKENALQPLMSIEGGTGKVWYDTNSGRKINPRMSAGSAEAQGFDPFPLTTQESERLAQTRSARTTINGYANALLASGLLPPEAGKYGEKRAVGAILNIASTELQTTPLLAVTNSLIAPLATRVIRSFGEVGNLSYYDAIVARAVMPKITDTAAVAYAKTVMLDMIFDSTQKQLFGKDTGTGIDQGLKTMMAAGAIAPEDVEAAKQEIDAARAARRSGFETDAPSVVSSATWADLFKRAGIKTKTREEASTKPPKLSPHERQRLGQTLTEYEQKKPVAPAPTPAPRKGRMVFNPETGMIE